MRAGPGAAQARDLLSSNRCGGTTPESGVRSRAARWQRWQDAPRQPDVAWSATARQQAQAVVAGRDSHFGPQATKLGPGLRTSGAASRRRACLIWGPSGRLALLRIATAGPPPLLHVAFLWQLHKLRELERSATRPGPSAIQHCCLRARRDTTRRTAEGSQRHGQGGFAPAGVPLQASGQRLRAQKR